LDKITIEGARVNNLKNISLEIPRNKLTVITGLSGSGKSSLAFDTIYAEGQRRYQETLSAYSRQFIGTMERPEVDKIDGLSPVIAIEQKTTIHNPRSTVGTVTEIYDFLRLLYARASTAYSKATGEKMVKYSESEIADLIISSFQGHRISIASPVVKGRKGHYRELLAQFQKKGFTKAEIDGKVEDLLKDMQLDRYKVHNINLIIDRLRVKEGDESEQRIVSSVHEALRQGKGTMMVIDDDNAGEKKYFSKNLMCPTTGIAYSEPAPFTFSFNSPAGACPHCSGLGVENVVNLSKIIPDPSLSIKQGAIEPLKQYKGNSVMKKIEALLILHGYDMNTPIAEMDEDFISALINGESEPLKVFQDSINGYIITSWEGLPEWMAEQSDLKISDKWEEQFLEKRPCSVCHGTRLKEEALYFKVDGKNISEISSMCISDLKIWADHVEEKLGEREKIIAHDILLEIRKRAGFLIDVGLSYLTLNRTSQSLSGGESQRIRLATQIGSRLINVLYIMDEPSIGLHQRDNIKLINSLRKLRDAGNSVIVVEHDEQMIRSADWIVDVGPKAGRSGGEICAIGKLDDILKNSTYTTDYLLGRRKIEIPEKRREADSFIEIKGARGNNLKNIDVKIPLGVLTCITGVSGSGKSSLISQTLRPALSRMLYRSYDQSLEYDSIEGIENIDKMIVVDQAPIGRTPRSNPATYTGVFADIRKLFENTLDAKTRGYKAGRFSFNVKGGRCETCKGAGVQTIEMNFLPDVYVTCPSCDGHRYNSDTLAVRYKGKNIDEVLDMTINLAVDFFEHIPSIQQKLKTIQDVGLGYIKLGQPCTTLSGGESQRIKLASELAKKDTGNTLYILDEPTTGLHFEDIRVLLDVLNRLIERGNSVVVIEHNLDVIKVADWVIDMGPEGGNEGGKVIAEGTPEAIVKNSESITGKFIREILNGQLEQTL